MPQATIPGTFDMTQPKMRKLFVEDAMYAVNSGAFDGVFIDRANFAERAVLDLEQAGPGASHLLALGWDLATAKALVPAQTQLFVELSVRGWYLPLLLQRILHFGGFCWDRTVPFALVQLAARQVLSTPSGSPPNEASVTRTDFARSRCSVDDQ
jgi:hypothetical protein